MNAPSAASATPAESLAWSIREWLALCGNLRLDASGVDAHAFHAAMAERLTQVGVQARALGIDAADAVGIQRALAGLLDEIALGAEGPLATHWQRAPLQWLCCGDHATGERFFDQMARLEARGPSARGLLALHHQVLAMGFRGRDPRSWGQRVTAPSPARVSWRDLHAAALARDRPHAEPWRHLPMAMAALGLAGALAASVAFAWRLPSQDEALLAQIRSAPPPATAPPRVVIEWP